MFSLIKFCRGWSSNFLTKAFIKLLSLQLNVECLAALFSRFTFNFFWQFQFKMSDEGEKDTNTGNKETDANRRQSGDENHSTELTVAQKFTVKKLKFAPDSAAPPTQNSDKSAESFGRQSPQLQSPTSPGQFTYGYATNEAIPMTAFYRSQHSQGHRRKRRPTLQELRKGFENDIVSVLMMSHKINSCTSRGIGRSAHESSCKILRLCFHKM